MKNFARGLVFTLLALSGSTFLATTGAYAETNAYDLKVDVSLNGQRVSAPRTTVREGEPALFTQMNGKRNEFVEVIASHTGQGNRAILMKFTVGTIDANGVRTVLSRPQIVAIDGQPAQLTESGKDGQSTLALSVIAHRTTL